MVLPVAQAPESGASMSLADQHAKITADLTTIRDQEEA